MKNLRKSLIASAIFSISFSAQAELDLKYFDKVIEIHQKETQKIEKIVALNKFERYYLDEIAPGVLSVNSMENPLPNNISIVELEDSLALINAGGTYEIARNIFKTLEEKSTKKIKYVFIENGQKINALAASYWIEKGSEVYMHRGSLEKYQNYFKDKEYKKIKEVSSKIKTLNKFYSIKGSEEINLKHYGPNLYRDSLVIEFPERNLAFTGDLILTSKALKFTEETDTFDWVNTYNSFIEGKDWDMKLIPNQGEPASLDKTKRTTFEYLRTIQTTAESQIRKGFGLKEIYSNIDLSQFSDMADCEIITGKNIKIVFDENY